MFLVWLLFLLNSFIKLLPRAFLKRLPSCHTLPGLHCFETLVQTSLPFITLAFPMPDKAMSCGQRWKVILLAPLRVWPPSTTVVMSAMISGLKTWHRRSLGSHFQQRTPLQESLTQLLCFKMTLYFYRLMSSTSRAVLKGPSMWASHSLC